VYLGAAAAGALLLAVTWYGAFHVGVLERADQSIFRGFAELQQHPHVSRVASFIAGLCNPNPYVYLAAIPVLLAFLRRRPRIAVVIAAILLGANVTTQLLKPLLAHSRAASLLGGVSPVSAASWPSGHATAAMSLALCMVLAVPARARPVLAAAGAAFAVAVSYSFLTLGWHYPSDVFGGFMVAATWTLLGLSAILAVERGQLRPARGSAQRLSLRDALAPPALTLLGALGLVVLALLARPHALAAYARAHEAFMVGAGAIGAAALAIATGLMLALRR
jgi:membrane-associated phospholipid phosphatase